MIASKRMAATEIGSHIKTPVSVWTIRRVIKRLEIINKIAYLKIDLRILRFLPNISLEKILTVNFFAIK